MKRFFCIVFVLLLLPTVFAIDSNDTNHVFSANIHLDKIPSIEIAQDTNDFVVLPNDSGKNLWFIKDGQTFYTERFFAGVDFAKQFLMDMSQKKLLLYDGNVIIPNNVLPLLKAAQDNILSFSVSQTTDTSKFLFLIKKVNGEIKITEKLHGSEDVVLFAGDVVYFLFDSDDYGLNSINFDFGERFLTLKVLVSQRVPIDEYYLTLPKKDDCEHWMNANESKFYCGFEHEFCASKAKELGCTIEEIITCRTQECLDRLVNEGKVQKSELELELNELKKSTIPEVKSQVDNLTNEVRQLAQDVNSTAAETQGVFGFGYALQMGLILIVIIVAISAVLIWKYQLQRAGVSKENELDFLNKTDNTEFEKFEKTILEGEKNGIQKERADSGIVVRAESVEPIGNIGNIEDRNPRRLERNNRWGN